MFRQGLNTKQKESGCGQKKSCKIKQRKGVGLIECRQCFENKRKHSQSMGFMNDKFKRENCDRNFYKSS